MNDSMRLSEAIRIGALMHPQTKGISVHRGIGGEIMGTCALGAAIVATDNIMQFWDILGSHTRHPFNDKMIPVMSVIASLNDEYNWTRNQIADWVEREIEHKGDKDEQRIRQEEYEYQARIKNSQSG